MDFVLLQDSNTVRNGGFARDDSRMKKKKGKVCSSARSSSSLSLRSLRRVSAAVPSSLDSPAYTSSSHKLSHVFTNQVSNSHSSERDNRLWKLIVEKQLEKAFTYLKKRVVVSREEISDLAACRRLIDDLCKTRRTRMAAQAVELLEATTTLDISTYTVLIKGLCKAGEFDAALKLFRRMEEGYCSCKPDDYTYGMLISAMFSKLGSVEVMKFLGGMMSEGFEPDVLTRTAVVSGLCKEGRLDEAVKLMSSNGWNPCVGSYNVVMSGLCKAGKVNDAEKLLADMAARGGDCSPSAVTFRMLIRTLCLRGSFYKAMALLESMKVKYGCTPNASHYILIIHSLCKLKKLGFAVEYIEVMISRGCYPNISIFNTLCASLWIHGNADAAVGLFNLLKASRGCWPNAVSYEIVIQGLSRFRKSDQALRLLREMRSVDEGLEPTALSYVSLFGGLIRDGKAYAAIQILDEIESFKVEVPYSAYNMIINGLCSIGETDRAIDLLVFMFSKGCRPIQSTYAVLIEGLARGGLGREAMELLNELSVSRIMGDSWSKGLAARIKTMCGLE